MGRRLVVIVALLLVVAGCADPVRVEKANAIRRESETQYMATATAVAISREEADVRIAATATAVADQETVMVATRPERVGRERAFVKWTGRFAVAWLLAVLVAFCIFSVGGAVAASRRANLEARLVRVDRATRTWPVMLDLKTGLLVDLETGERARLGDVSRVDDRRLVISGQVRAVGLLAQSAERIAKGAKSADPGDMLPAIGQSVPALVTPGPTSPAACVTKASSDVDRA
jgi:hypothetical protein